MTKRDLTRRTALRTLGGGLVLTAGVPTVTAASSDELSTQLNTVRAATRGYRDVQRARDDGYDDHVSVYVPGMGFHFENESLVAANETVAHPLDEPATLVYQTKGNYNPAPGQSHDPARDDDLLLGAAEFLHEGTSGADADYFDDEDATRTVKTPEADGWTAVPGTGHTGLHVWVHRGNPDGAFAPFNPTVD